MIKYEITVEMQSGEKVPVFVTGAEDLETRRRAQKVVKDLMRKGAVTSRLVTPLNKKIEPYQVYTYYPAGQIQKITLQRTDENQ